MLGYAKVVSSNLTRGNFLSFFVRGWFLSSGLWVMFSDTGFR